VKIYVVVTKAVSVSKVLNEPHNITGDENMVCAPTK